MTNREMIERFRRNLAALFDAKRIDVEIMLRDCGATEQETAAGLAMHDAMVAAESPRILADAERFLESAGDPINAPTTLRLQ